MNKDNGNDTVIANATGDARHQANAKASAYAKAILKAESSLAGTAKELGQLVFVSVYKDGNNLDTIIGENKLAAGWATLATSEAGRKAKQRLEVAFSSFRLVAERWTSLTDEQRDNILSGNASVLYLASEMRKADSKAKAEAAKAEAAAEAAASATAIVEATESLNDKVIALIAAYNAAPTEQRDEAFESLSALFDLVNNDTTVVDPSLAEAA